MAILNNSNAISSGGYDINNSLRFRSSASAYLNRTPSVAGNRRTWTYSAWIKRGNITPAAGGQSIFYAGSSVTTPRGGIVFGNSGSDNKLSFNGMLYNSATQVLGLETSAEFRDPSAWYHIVVVLDTTQATSSNRAKIYVNGSQVTAFGTATYPSLNQELQYNDAILHATRHPSGDYEYDGYLAEVNFIDGQALTPSSFGETDATTGSWVAKKYTGTYGTNGFYLKFSDIATTSGSNAGLGKDFSGNANYWTTNNISVTAGTTYDAMIDSPTLTSATVANYATLNPLLILGGIVGTYTNGNLNFSAPTVADYYYCSTIFTGTTGKYYSEVTINTIGSGILIGVIDQSQVGTAWGNKSSYRDSGLIYDLSGNTVGTSGNTYTTGDVIGVAVDIGAGTVQFYKNNVAQGATPSFSFTAGTPLAFAGRSNNSGANVAYNFGQRPFSYTPPTGFVRLNTFNLPTPTILQGNKYMDATTYTGNGSTQVLVNQGQFKPDFVWVKARSATYNHTLYDSIRGVNNYLISNLTNAAASSSDTLQAFNSNGFTVGTNQGLNENASTYVGWQWQAGQGSNTTNTAGTVTSTVSVNATAGFSVVLYTGNGGAMTMGHGLGVAPKLIILKDRDIGRPWPVYHGSLATNQYLILNTTAAAATSTSYWNNTAPTSTVFSVNGLEGNVGANGEKYVAYCWAEIAGFSKFGSYTGNGSIDGPFVYLGFRPKFIMFKRADGVGGWLIDDSIRDTYNYVDLELLAHSSDAEAASGSDFSFDYLSNGFKVRRLSSSSLNVNAATIIYMAFAESPFKSSLAR